MIIPTQYIVPSGTGYQTLTTNIFIGWNSSVLAPKTQIIPAPLGTLTTIVISDLFGNAGAYPITPVAVSGVIFGSPVVGNNNKSLTLLDTSVGWVPV